MTEKQANKILAKEKKRLDNEFKTNFKKVRTKIRRIKLLAKTDKTVLNQDLSKVNGDLMDVLVMDKDPWNTVSDYFDTVNAYLRSETDSYDYNDIILAYMPSKMEHLMTIIRNQHKIIDQKERLKKIVGM